MSRDEAYLRHILGAIGRVEQYTAVGRTEFLTTPHWQDATIRQLEVIGEAAKHLSEATRSRQPDVPWRRIAGLRDVLIHDYMGVDLDAVWEVSQEHLGALRVAVEQLLEDH